MGRLPEGIPTLSRVADAVYWLNRYVERAENVARFVDVNLNLSLDLPEGVENQWMPLVETTGDVARFRAAYGEAATKENVLRFLTADASNPNSILACLRAARENARTIREIVSSELLLHVNRAYLDAEEALRDGAPADAPAFLSRVKLASHLFAGLMDATMSHNEAYHFGLLGRWLERADKTSRILDVKYFYLLPRPADVGSPLDDLQWQAVLKSASALEMYRKQKRRRITPRDVADFLLLDEEFPRSVRHCVRRAEESLHRITGSPRRAFGNEAEKLLGRLASDLDYVTIDDVLLRGLHEELQAFQSRLAAVGDAVHGTFFAPAAAGTPASAPGQ